MGIIGSSMAEIDPVTATASALGSITDLVNSDGYQEQFRFTSALANGRDLYAFRYAANDSANSLYYRASGGSVVIVSEPLDNDRTRWIEVPNNSVVAARAEEPVQIFPLVIERPRKFAQKTKTGRRGGLARMP
jgi:glutamine amidotransferase